MTLDLTQVDETAEYDTEMLLGTADMDKSIIFPKDMHILTDPNVWIGHSAATTHATLHEQGMINSKTDAETFLVDTPLIC